MDITYLGHSSFKIRTKTATVVTDPYLAEAVGLKFPKTEADIITVSHQHRDHNAISNFGPEPFVIALPGEYEVKGVSVFGYASFHDTKNGAERGPSNIYVIESEGLRICHLGDLGTLPDATILEEISAVDVLMIPVGGEVTLGPKEAGEVINKIEPLIVLPMHYKEEGLNEEKFGNFATLKDFLVEMGTEQAEKLDKLSLTKDKLPPEMKVVLLERKS